MTDAVTLPLRIKVKVYQRANDRYIVGGYKLDANAKRVAITATNGVISITTWLTVDEYAALREIELVEERVTG